LFMARAAPRAHTKSEESAKSTARRRRPAGHLPATPRQSPAVRAARRKFLRAFPGGFRDETYLDWERNYKWSAHLRWQEALNEVSFRQLVAERQFGRIAALASTVESRTKLLFSFEKMALRDAVRSAAGAQAFSTALFDLLHGSGVLETRRRWTRFRGGRLVC
jgi:hypothetical protein